MVAPERVPSIGQIELFDIETAHFDIKTECKQMI